MADPDVTREITLTRGKVAIVDAADHEWLSQWKWMALKAERKDGPAFYAIRWTPRPNRTAVYMHRQIMGLPCGRLPEVDHKDGCGLHNWRGNLRIATRMQNAQNHRLRQNAAGFPGIHEAPSGSWVAKLQVSRRSLWLGSYATREEAFAAHREASLKHFGEFSPFA